MPARRLRDPERDKRLEMSKHVGHYWLSNHQHSARRTVRRHVAVIERSYRRRTAALLRAGEDDVVVVKDGWRKGPGTPRDAHLAVRRAERAALQEAPRKNEGALARRRARRGRLVT